MALSMGIDYSQGRWKTCLIENGTPVELLTFADTHAAFAYVEELCAIYPELSIALSSPFDTSFGLLHTITASSLLRHDLKDFLAALGTANLNSYSLPAIKYLPSIPRYRKLNRNIMGFSDTLCSVATLLYRMRQREAGWHEMRFLYLEVGPTSRNIIVVKDGSIVDGMSTVLSTEPCQNGHSNLLEDELIIEQAFWEGLTQDLAGLMALHHFEDIVLMDYRSGEQTHKETIIDKLGDNYQFYLFPHHESEPQGFEAAIGASLIAEGLHHPGLAADVAQQLLFPPIQV